MSKRQYSDIRKAQALAALDANGGNVKRTAIELGIPRKTLEGWARDEDGVSEDVAKLRHEETETLAMLLEEAARATIKSITEDINNGKGELKDKSITAAILLDKHQLLIGKPTARNENIEYQDRVDDLRQRRNLRQAS